mmetsp:Transcript_53330/g.142723  ORF Transcript_53330/g.142723 Transcript_53330/m.142723 type:complete len:115 (-) Transcript_53330:82-426(-)
MTFALVTPARWFNEIPRATAALKLRLEVSACSRFDDPVVDSKPTIHAEMRSKTVSRIHCVRWFNETLLPHDLRARVASSHVLKPTMLQGHLSPAFSRVVCMFKASLHRLDGFPL